ncbi:MAG: Mut7-C RNAse domain-containing protein [Nitrospiraceae bacterium]|nr:Mut7-C RNAse domain-containing protein [Nitrospiraceae bacterium]
MKFIADAMLGRLARWLRVLGFDVLYYSDIGDGQLVKTAREEERTILTRDTHFLERRQGADVMFIHDDDVFAQLVQIRDKLDFRDIAPLGRCMICNGMLERVAQKEDVRDSVPEFIYLSVHDFVKCGGCGKIYWCGSHQQGIRKKILSIFPDYKGLFYAAEDGGGK